MSFIRILSKFYQMLETKNGFYFSHTRAEDETYLQAFKEPIDDIERSYKQYACQKWNNHSRIKHFFVNVGAAVLFYPYYIGYRFRNTQPIKQEHHDAVLTHSFIKTLLPTEFCGSYINQEFNKGSLTKDDSILIFKLWKCHPFSFYFIFKCMCRIASYSDLIRNFTPRIVFSSAEYSFTSSILTNYCENHSIEHINIMHGEKFFDLTDAFSRFTKFYVWEDCYIGLFNSLRANKTQYLVGPIKVPKVNFQQRKNCYVYYLQLQTKPQLLKIKELLVKLGKDYLVRPHPLHYTRKTREVFSDDQIENFSTVDIWDSIQQAEFVVSAYSTVLYQACLLNKTVVIDDISDPELYSELAERDYIMFKKPHLLLSEILR